MRGTDRSTRIDRRRSIDRSNFAKRAHTHAALGSPIRRHLVAKKSISERFQQWWASRVLPANLSSFTSSSCSSDPPPGPQTACCAIPRVSPTNWGAVPCTNAAAASPRRCLVGASCPPGFCAAAATAATTPGSKAQGSGLGPCGDGVRGGEAKLLLLTPLPLPPPHQSAARIAAMRKKKLGILSYSFFLTRSNTFCRAAMIINHLVTLKARTCLSRAAASLSLTKWSRTGCRIALIARASAGFKSPG